MEERELVSLKVEDPKNAVEFRDATLAWEKARQLSATASGHVTQKPRLRGSGIRRLLRREKLSLFIGKDGGKSTGGGGGGGGDGESPNEDDLLSHMEQESPQSTISSTQSMRPPLLKTLHRIDLRVKKVCGLRDLSP